MNNRFRASLAQLDIETVSSNLIKSAWTVAAPRSLVYHRIVASSVDEGESAGVFKSCCWTESGLQGVDPTVIAVASGTGPLSGLVALRTL